MITPSIRGGHEVAQPVAVEGAEVGDAIAIRIKAIEVTSLATASGNDGPVKVAGGGVYLGDMHALQGDGEIAGHTADVDRRPGRGRGEVVKDLPIDGPLLFPVAEDLLFLARPLTEEERLRELTLARRHGVAELEETLPMSVVGSGPDLNSATDNGLARAAELLGMSVPEVKNRATVTGAIEIGRHPGVVQVTFRAPVRALEERGLAGYAREQYAA